jgi:hypothetical protein
VDCYGGLLRRRIHVAEKGLMRGYNPKLENFEWRKVPASDKEALSLFESYPNAEDYAEIYREWRSRDGHHDGTHAGGRSGKERREG